MKSGIYQIKNTKNNKVYVGSAKDFAKRWKRHLEDLRKRKHHSVKLQRSYDIHGKESYEFSILEELPYEKEIIIERENFWIKKLNSKYSGYNIADASFGDIISTHPNRNDIIARRSETIKKSMKELGSEGRRLKYAKYGADNGNFNPLKEIFYCKCGATIGKTAKSCGKCRDKSGENNPFFGKTHSEKTKKILSDARKGKAPSNIKMTSADGKLFSKATECAKHFNIASATVTYRIKSDKWPEWFYINAERLSQ